MMMMMNFYLSLINIRNEIIIGVCVGVFNVCVCVCVRARDVSGLVQISKFILITCCHIVLGLPNMECAFLTLAPCQGSCWSRSSVASLRTSV